MEQPIAISYLNDFIFCPVSIYFHNLDNNSEKLTFQSEYQINGTYAHEKSDSGLYSSRKSILQAIPVYCEKYGLEGKIDLFDSISGVLTERKRTVKKIYDGYVFQIYAQYFALTEMGYSVKKLRIYSMTDNKSYPIDLPENDPLMLRKFEKTVLDIKTFDFESFRQTCPDKCKNCIYEPLCYYSKKVII